MRKNRAVAAAVAGAVATAGLAAVSGAAAAASPASQASQVSQVSQANQNRVVGLTDAGRLVSFPAVAPKRTSDLGRIGGLSGDTWLVGIDYRVQNGVLYGVGDAGGVYTIDPRKGRVRATKVSQLTVALQGTRFGVDFNPAANRLRIVSDTGQNLRHNIDDPNGAPAAGTTATDGTLSYAPPAAATGVTGAAYTNNDLDPTTATTLFDIDTALDQVSVQSPANAGSLAATGKLGVDAGPWVGFDISASNRALATLDPGHGMKLYTIDLLTGKATKVGAFPHKAQVVDIAIPLPRPKPTPGS